jgi:hypothetical protein
MAAWQVKRRERTRHLIELGGLVVKAGLIELVDDDRAVILGLLTEAAARLRSEDRKALLMLWQRRGKRAFAAEEDGHDDACSIPHHEYHPAYDDTSG